MLNTWVDLRGKKFDGSACETLKNDPAYQELKAAILGADTHEAVRAAPYAGQPPYRGLLHFDVGDAHLFYGRERRTQWLLEELRRPLGDEFENRFLAIIGASGSGKSSLARAGLLAGLQRGRLPGSEHWPLIICRPGPRPLEALAVALAKHPATIGKVGDVGDLIKRLRAEDNRLHLVTQLVDLVDDSTDRVVVFVDQFEELFTLCQDDQERAAFVENLTRAAMEPRGRTIVVLTLRADFYGQCAGSRPDQVPAGSNAGRGTARVSFPPRPFEAARRAAC